jgi:hypothetical protein
MFLRKTLSLAVLLFLTLFALTLSPTAVEATSFNTIPIDGTNGFAADETFSTSSAGYTAYATWDADNLYLGFTGGDVGAGESATKWMVWYIDTDPQCGPNGGNGTNYAAPFKTQKWSLPFRADYFMQVRTDEGLNQLNRWNSPAWTAAIYSGNISQNDGANFIELSLPLSDIGDPTNIRILGYFINEQDGGEWTYASWPANSLAGSDGFKRFGAFYNWYEFELVNGVAPNAAANNSPAQNCIIDPSVTEWGFLAETGSGNGSYVVGPGTPPAGQGSVRLITPAAADGHLVGTPAFAGVRLADISALSYATYRTSGSLSLANALQLNLDFDLTDTTTTYQGRLVYEPYRQSPAPTIPDNTWQTWDTIAGGDGRWWASAIPSSNPCGQDNPCTWGTILTTFPNAGINFDLPGFLVKAGSNWAGFDGNVDNLAITVNGVAYTFDLEPNLPVHNITQNTDHPTIQAGINAANPNDELEIDPGTYVENVVVNKSITLRGSGAGTDPALHTILDGTSFGPTVNSGIKINANVTYVTIEDLTVRNYTLNTSEGGGIYGVVGNHNLTVRRVHALNNTGGRGGVFLNGPVDTVLFDQITAHNNTSRGIVIWNGFKTNITITNSDVRNNNCCGIELQDGTASGVTITGNTVVDNIDSGIAATGLMAGAGPNLIANNTVTDNGRFGIEIKLPNGTGATSGDGSIVIQNNIVSRSFVPADARDLAGIAVYRRGWLAGNVDIPTGVVVRNNTVTGYQQTTTSDGFGIVVEGTNMAVSNNTLNNNDVGVQVQAGHTPYQAETPGEAFNGNQNNLDDDYFGRGNSPVACATVSGNSYTSNAVDYRLVGASANDTPSVHNQTANTYHCSIQEAINAAGTLNGHTLVVSAGSYPENVTVNKGVTLQGPNVGTAGNAARVAEAIIDGGTGTAVVLSANNATLDGFNIKGSVGVSLGNFAGAVIQNNLIETDDMGVQVVANANPFTIQNNAIALSQQVGAQLTVGIALNGLSGDGSTIADNDIADAFYGYVLHAVNTTPPTTISGGEITGVMQGVAVVNTLDGSAFFPSTFAVEDVAMSGFSGDYSEIPALAGANFHSGIYVFTGSGTTGASTISGSITDVNVSSTGKPGPNSAALHFADFGSQANAQTISVEGGVLANNLNRGMYATGNVVVTVNNIALTNNGADPFTTGGNDGYGVIVRGGARVDISNSTIANPASQTSGVSYAFHTSQTGSALTVRGNQISNGNIFQITSGTSLLAYANNITSFANANLPGAGTVNARHNWWGSHEMQPTGVDNNSWDFRLGAPVVTWADGTGAISLADAFAGGNAGLAGSGTLVIVNHGGSVPFDKAIPEDSGGNRCADYYDFFAIGGSGNYSVSIPVDGTNCNEATIDAKLFQFAVGASGEPDLTCAPDTACWNAISATRDGDVLTASGVPAADLLGTPFAAPSVNNNDPTAVSLATFTNASNAGWGWLAAAAVSLMAVFTGLSYRRRAATK